MQAFLTEDREDLEETFERLDAAAGVANGVLAKYKGGERSLLSRLMSLGTGSAGDSTEESGPEDVARLVARVILAEIGLIYGFLHLRSGAYVKGSYQLRKSWKRFAGLVRDHGDDPELDPYVASSLALGSGMFLFFISLTPPKFLWLITFVGFEADRDGGLARLRTAASQPLGQRAPMALLFVIWVEMFFVERLDVAEALVEDALAVFPSGAMYLYLRGYMKRKRGDLEGAEADFTAVIDASEGELPQLALAATYELGSVYYMGQKWEQAGATLMEFLERNRSPSFQAYAALQAGYARTFAGNESPDSIVPLMESIPDRVRKHYTFDQFAARKGLEYAAKGGLDPLESSLIRALNLIEASDPEGALALLETEVPLGPDAIDRMDYRGIYQYAVGLASARAHPSDPKGLELLQSVVDTPVAEMGDEVYVIPHAMTEAASVLLESGEVDHAVALLRRAKSDFSEYDFDKPLIRRITRLLDTYGPGAGPGPGPSGGGGGERGFEVLEFDVDRFLEVYNSGGGGGGGEGGGDGGDGGDGGE